MADVEVRDHPAEQRYEAWVHDELAGFAAYERDEDLVVFTHTQVEDAFEGQGIGSALARAALDDSRAAGRGVVPRCPFVRGWIQRHPDYQDLVEE